MLLIEIVLVTLSLILVAPGVLILVELIASLPKLSPRERLCVVSQSDVDLVVLIPAHNEAEVIADSLRSLKSSVAPTTRILVVADNCDDQTATIARSSLDVEVIERNDETARGKGFALDYGIRHLAANPPDIVAVLDADCIVSKGGIEAMGALAVATGRPVQALNQMLPNIRSGAKQQIAAFAFTVKNIARGIGLQRLVGFVSLTGTGMAFPWTIIANAKLASSHQAEDLKLSADLARRQIFATLCTSARITSEFPATAQALESQKKRWQHGHLKVITDEGLPILFLGLRHADWRQVIYGMDMIVPPLVLYLIAMVTATVSALFLYFLGVGVLPVLILGSIIFALMIGITAVWLRFGRGILSIRTIQSIPGYVVSNVSLALSKRQSKWVRTARK